MCFGSTADDAARLSENDRVSIEGKLQTRKYEVNGKASYITEVIAFDLDKLASNTTASGSAMPTRVATTPPSNGVGADALGDMWRDDGRPF
ncbi:hypothetical protein A2G96_12775 [Cupriavidus nantongensis]|uniref:Single-stranded DNA-binding protein n=1 Tax=Cupriavidus nantongensis TaxID=1796606 RepID=A0A142JKD0_9BURK|nr:hypothetical protein A2G96_12775 [Cupriavidus nantongensis]